MNYECMQTSNVRKGMWTLISFSPWDPSPPQSPSSCRLIRITPLPHPLASMHYTFTHWGSTPTPPPTLWRGYLGLAFWLSNLRTEIRLRFRGRRLNVCSICFTFFQKLEKWANKWLIRERIASVACLKRIVSERLNGYISTQSITVLFSLQ